MGIQTHSPDRPCRIDRIHLYRLFLNQYRNAVCWSTTLRSTMGSVLLVGRLLRFRRHARQSPWIPHDIHQFVLGHRPIPSCWSHGCCPRQTGSVGIQDSIRYSVDLAYPTVHHRHTRSRESVVLGPSEQARRGRTRRHQTFQKGYQNQPRQYSRHDGE